MTLFDRYLLKRFAHVFLISYFAAYGLYVIIDGFTNVDNFQENAGEDGGAAAVLLSMGQHYSYQSTLFLELAGPVLSVISVMAVLALILKNSEIYPLLSAGVPMWRLLMPLLFCATVVSGLLIANQELVIPKLAGRLQAPRGEQASEGQQVEEAYDRKTGLEIYGEELYLSQRMLKEASFSLPVGEMAREWTVLRAPEAVFYDVTPKHPAGWLLKNADPPFQELKLSPNGRELIKPVRGGRDVFVTTDVSFDQLNNRNAGYRYLSTPELIRRVRNPSFGLVSLRSQTLHLHERFTRPLMIVLSAVIAAPLVIRRESRSIIGNMAIAAGVLAGVFLFSQACLYLGRANLVSLELAAWCPLIAAGTLGAWLKDVAQT